MKSGKVIRWLDAGIWPATVLFSCGFGYDELIKRLKKVKANQWALGISEDRKLIESGNYFALKRTLSNSKEKREVTFFYIIIKKPFDFSDYMYCTLAHEILHIVQFMMPDMLDMEREYEAVAYTHTYFMEKILKILRGK
jgi:hypothetical protein